MKSERKPKQIKTRDIEEAFKWIERLSPKQRKRFEQLAQVQLAQLLMQEYFGQVEGKENNRRSIKRKK